MIYQNTLARLLVLLLVVIVTNGCSNTPPIQVPEGAAQTEKSSRKQQWLCEAGVKQQWRCSDLAHAKTGTQLRQPKTSVASIPVTHKTITAVETKAPVAKTLATKASTTNLATTGSLANNPTPTADNKLAHYPDNYVVVQLIAARAQQTVDSFVQQHPQLPLQQLSTIRDGQQWHHLILGPYPTYNAAQQAIAAIDPPLATAPWIRPVAPLNASIASPTP